MMSWLVWYVTRRRNNDIPGQCSESTECMAERQTQHTTERQKKRVGREITKGGESNREEGKRETRRESGD